jgi:hypothetical protein
VASQFKKYADGEATVLPNISVPSQPAQDKNTLPGMVPPIAYTKVNASTPPVPDAGAGQQKAQPPLGAQMLPKLAQALSRRGEDHMNTTPRPLVQDLVKKAMEGASQRSRVAAEGARQQKLAAEKCEKCGKSPCECKDKEKSASAVDDTPVTTEYALKLASAIEYATPFVLAEMSKKAAPNMPPPHFAEKVQQPPEGTLVSNVPGTTPGPGQQGHGHNTVPEKPGNSKGLPAEHGSTMVENTLHHAPGGGGTQTTAMSGGKGKVASAPLTAEKNLSFLRKLAGEEGDIKGLEAAKKSIEKVEEHEKKEEHEEKKGHDEAASALLAHIKEAEDAINPAQISAGPAVPPETSAAGQPGGEPVGGKPQGPSGLVGSNQAAIDYKKGTAYAPRKSELAQYFNEPALSSATDKTLSEAFSHTGEAGVKISAANIEKVAAARALLSKLADNTTQPKA